MLTIKARIICQEWVNDYAQPTGREIPFVFAWTRPLDELPEEDTYESDALIPAGTNYHAGPFLVQYDELPTT